MEGGVEMGFKAKDAQKIVLQTVKGAVELLQATGEHPEAAIDHTHSRRLYHQGLEHHGTGGFTSAVINGLLAGKDKRLLLKNDETRRLLLMKIWEETEGDAAQI